MTPLRYLLQRQKSGPKSTIGEVSCDGVMKWFVCEDVVREPPVISRTEGAVTFQQGADTVTAFPADWVATWKQPGVTAIPSGTYRLVITPSTRFHRETIQLLNVPGFTGIRIHPGNQAADSEGCLLPGMTTASGAVFASQQANQVWHEEVRSALLAGRECWIEIRNAE